MCIFALWAAIYFVGWCLHNISTCIRSNKINYVAKMNGDYHTHCVPLPWKRLWFYLARYDLHGHSYVEVSLLGCSSLQQKAHRNSDFGLLLSSSFASLLDGIVSIDSTNKEKSNTPSPNVSLGFGFPSLKRSDSINPSCFISEA